MKIIIFIWNNCVHIGEIIKQVPSSIQGQLTEIEVSSIDRVPTDNMTIYIYGRCRVGHCGPFNVLTIQEVDETMPTKEIEAYLN